MEAIAGCNSCLSKRQMLSGRCFHIKKGGLVAKSDRWNQSVTNLEKTELTGAFKASFLKS